MLEMNHCELGALLAERWNLTSTIIAVLRLHHTIEVPKDAPGRTLIAMTNLAEKLLPTFNMGEQMSSEIAVEDWQSLGIEAGQIAEVEAAMHQRAEEIAVALS
jgi:HD-like signal output (HDOD) protein